jgi:hypothetical protein
MGCLHTMRDLAPSVLLLVLLSPLLLNHFIESVSLWSTTLERAINECSKLTCCTRRHLR